jgi:hypothetical protein
MTNYIEDSYIESEFEEIFNIWYEIEGVKKIKELSRHLRIFFNYKTEVIRYRFRSSPFPAKNCANTKFFSQKQKIESFTYEYITILKKLKTNTQTLEQGIRSLFFWNNKIQLKNLLVITEKLFILLHYFSEESLQDHPKILKFNITLAKNICLVKKCLYTQFNEFFEELEINYNNLEGELEELIGKTPIEKEQSKKQLEERLTT